MLIPAMLRGYVFCHPSTEYSLERPTQQPIHCIEVGAVYYWPSFAGIYSLSNYSICLENQTSERGWR